MSEPRVALDKLLGDLPAGIAEEIIKRLQINQNWKKLGAVVTRQNRTNLMFNFMDIELFEIDVPQAARKLFTNLMTEGYTLQWLLDDMIKIQLYLIADFITVDILNGEPASRIPENNNVAEIVQKCSAIQIHGATCGESTDDEPMPTFLGVQRELYQFPYSYLKLISNNFDQTHLSKGGRLIGEGGYGLVFYGEENSRKLAIKRLHGGSTEDFDKEIQTMLAIQHANILPLLGYSDDGEDRCIVYPYMANGSLEDCIECKHTSTSLSVSQRLDITIGLAKGIDYLHTRTPVLIHRDIKSANVLLDDKFVPKLGDFGIVRSCPSIGSECKSYTQTMVIKGTMVYIAPEVFQLGKLSPKSDIYSYGVILYEVLTGLKAYDNTREDTGLVMHVEAKCDDNLCYMMAMLDKKVTRWTETVVDCIFSLAQRCINIKANKRPGLLDAIVELQLCKQTYETEESHTKVTLVATSTCH